MLRQIQSFAHICISHNSFILTLLDHVQKEWRTRKRYFSDALGTLAEGMGKSSKAEIQDFMEELGVETDEMVGCVYEPDEPELKRAKR